MHDLLISREHNLLWTFLSFLSELAASGVEAKICEWISDNCDLDSLMACVMLSKLLCSDGWKHIFEIVFENEIISKLKTHSFLTSLANHAKVPKVNCYWSDVANNFCHENIMKWQNSNNCCKESTIILTNNFVPRFIDFDVDVRPIRWIDRIKRDFHKKSDNWPSKAVTY